MHSSSLGSHAEGDLPRRDRMTCLQLPITESMFWLSVAERERVLSSMQSPLVRRLFCLRHDSAEDIRSQSSMIHLTGWAFQNQERQAEEPGGAALTYIQHSAPEDRMSHREKNVIAPSSPLESWLRDFIQGEKQALEQRILNPFPRTDFTSNRV